MSWDLLGPKVPKVLNVLKVPKVLKVFKVPQNDLCKKQMLYKYVHISGPKGSPNTILIAF